MRDVHVLAAGNITGKCNRNRPQAVQKQIGQTGDTRVTTWAMPARTGRNGAGAR